MVEIINSWQTYLASLDDWQNLIQGIKPKETGNGLIYELGNHLNRPDESFAIADMRSIRFAQPHYHPEVEIYFILQGSGLVVIGGKEEQVQKNSIIVIPSNRAHFTIPHENLVLAIVNTPPFNAKNYFPLTHDNKEVMFERSQFDRLVEQ